MRLDLHLHTHASDGQFSAEEVVAQALALGLNVIAITDHDTTEGVLPAQTAAASTSLQVLAGIELSAEDDAGDVHMLGYCLNIANPILQERLQDFRENRYFRGNQILKKLATLGVNVSWERVLEMAGVENDDPTQASSIGRPHIARAMVEAGYVDTVKEAFNRYIANDGPAYVARTRLTPEEAIELIHTAQGVAVLAHPGLLPQHVAMVERLVPAGLDGVEVVHPQNTENVRLDLRGLAKIHGLVMTGGSDFHGPNIKEVKMGSVNPPPDAVTQLLERAERYQ